jgi:hypothetical protein
VASKGALLGIAMIGVLMATGAIILSLRPQVAGSSTTTTVSVTTSAGCPFTSNCVTSLNSLVNDVSLVNLTQISFSVEGTINHISAILSTMDCRHTPSESINYISNTEFTCGIPPVTSLNQGSEKIAGDVTLLNTTNFGWDINKVASSVSGVLGQSLSGIASITFGSYVACPSHANLPWICAASGGTFDINAATSLNLAVDGITQLEWASPQWTFLSPVNFGAQTVSDLVIGTGNSNSVAWGVLTSVPNLINGLVVGSSTVTGTATISAVAPITASVNGQSIDISCSPQCLTASTSLSTSCAAGAFLNTESISASTSIAYTNGCATDFIPIHDTTTVSTSTTAQEAITGCSAALLANTNYQIQVLMPYASSVTTDGINPSFTFSGTTTQAHILSQIPITATSIIPDYITSTGMTDGVSTGVTTQNGVLVTGEITVGANGGTFQFTFGVKPTSGTTSTVTVFGCYGGFTVGG